MPYKVVLKEGLSQVALPNGGVYNGGDEILLADEDFSTIGATTLVDVFSSVTAVGGGSGSSAVESVNGQTGEVVLVAADVGAADAAHTHTPASIGAATTGHTHTAASIGAAAAAHTHTAADVGAAPTSHTHTPASIGAAETAHTHTAADVGAAAATHTHTAAQVTGTFAATQIPTLDAGKVGTGTFAAARLPKGVAVVDLAVEADLAAVVAKVNELLASLRVNHLTP